MRLQQVGHFPSVQAERSRALLINTAARGRLPARTEHSCTYAEHISNGWAHFQVWLCQNGEQGTHMAPMRWPLEAMRGAPA